jgi:outer membrane protein assembly factor BamE (lipoprotein component of BamABCDE complex)
VILATSHNSGHLHLRLIVQSLIIATLVLSSCSTVIGPVEPQVVAEHLAYLREGQTTRQEVIEHLGSPLQEYEQGGIVSYVLLENSDGQFEVIRGRVIAKPPIYNLVLSFGADGVLTRLSLLRLE